MGNMKKKQPFEFSVDESSDIPLWVQLKRRMVFLIESGHYEPGEQLPTVRGLAGEIQVNYNTVNKVYLSLAADGYIESIRGRGAFVLGPVASGDAAKAKESDELVNDFIQACRNLGLSYDDILVSVTRRVKTLKFEETFAGDPNVITIKSAASRKSV